MKNIICKTKLIRLAGVVAFVVAMLFCCAVSVSAEGRKVINIVYDDTSETYYDGESEFSDKWSRIKNALQTFVSLSNSGDRIVVYPLSGKGEKIEIVNDAQINERIDALDNQLVGYATERSFEVVKKAYEDLKKESIGYEKWLLIVCDGKFKEYEEASEYGSVQKQLVSYASDGIKVISHAVSNNGAIYNLKSEENFYCYNTSDTKDILQQTIEISNFIYQRKTLPDEYLKFDKKANTLTIKDTGLPMSQIILCVNGADARVGSAVGGVGATSEIKIDEIKSFPKLFSDSEREMKFAANLERRIYNYKFSPLLPSEEMNIVVSEGDSVRVIYKPEAAMKLRLYRNGNPIGENESISTGKYTYKVNILNPLDGSEIESPLLDGAVYSIKTENQANVTKLSEKEGEISFLKGRTKVETSVDLGTTKFSKTENFYVFGDVDFSFVEVMKYKVNKLDGCKPIRILVKTESSPENISLSCSSGKNIDFSVKRSGKENEFMVYPAYKNGKSYLFAPTGNVDVVFTVRIDENGQVLTYSKTGSILIEDVSMFKRMADWIWHYKWFLIIVVFAVVCYVVAAKFILKKLELKKNVEIEDADVKEAEKGDED